MAYNSLNWLVGKNILEKQFKRYRLNARTPKFLLNPEDLYTKPLAIVKDMDYAMEAQISRFASNLMKELPGLVREEMKRIGTEEGDAEGTTTGDSNKEGMDTGVP